VRPSDAVRSTDTLPSVDDATVERQLRFHERINRASLAICAVLAVDVGALYLGIVPIALRAYVRPVLVLGVMGLAALEAWRHLGHGQQAGRLRWTRLTIGACIGALTIGQAVHHIRPSVDPTGDRPLGIAAWALAIALLCDLREFPDRSRHGALARVGIVVGALGTAIMGAILLGEAAMPLPVWWRLFLGSTVLIAIAGGIYLRVRGALSGKAVP
jgi:hypothetical protein